MSPNPPQADRPPPDGAAAPPEDQLAENLARTQTTEALARFAQRTVHSLNNFLMVFSGGLDLLEAALDTDPERARGMMETLRESVCGTEDLVEQLQSIRGTDLGNVEEMDLHGLISELLPSLMDAFAEDAEIRLHPAKTAAITSVDRGAFKIALHALVQNAVEASPDGAQVQLRTYTLVIGEDGAYANLSPGVYAVLEVEDAGSGMDADARARLFEPGYTTKPGQDHGFGLATTWGIVRQHDGCVVVDSEPGRGTLVRVLLPATGVISAIE